MSNQDTNETAQSTPDTSLIGGERLRSFIERIERLQEEEKAIKEDVKEVYAESKSDGFNVKTIRTIVAIRKMEPNDRQEAEYLLETYMSALGMA
jgi:uncharacterized protein (UPF0335 family)